MHQLLDNFKIDSLFELFDHISELQFWIKDIHGAFLKVNKGFLENYALTDEKEVIGKTDFDLSPPYLAKLFTQDDQEVLKGKTIINRVELVYSAHQIAHWHITNKRILYSKNNEIIGTLGITQRLTDESLNDVPISNLNLMLDYIHKNIHKKINIKDLARVMNCSVNTLERKFKNIFHCTPSDFIRKIKIESASKSLISTDQPISEIAFNLGFADMSHFIRDFKKHMHITPHQYRKQYFNKIL